MIIIPDIHGRTFWKQAIQGKETEDIVFLGDYLDPYSDEGISGADALLNFREKDSQKPTIGSSCFEVIMIILHILRMNGSSMIDLEPYRIILWFKLVDILYFAKVEQSVLIAHIA